MDNLKNDPIKFIEEYCGNGGSGREFKLLPYQEALIEKLRQPDVHLSIVSMVVRHPGRLTRMLFEAMIDELEQGERPVRPARENSGGE
jgi:hypothetical protein